MITSWNRRKAIVIAILLMAVCFLFPMLLNLKFSQLIDPLVKNDEDFDYALARTIILSIITTVIVVPLSLLLSILLFSVKLNTWTGRNLSLLLAPVLLGNTATAFIFRVCFSNTALFTDLLNNHNAGIMILWILLQFWQYGTLFIYLLYLSYQSIPAAILDYAKATNLSFRTIAKDIILPFSRNLVILITVISFVFTFYEDARSSMVFYFSRGAQNELIAGWFQRVYLQKIVYISADKASIEFYNSGLFVAVTALLIVWISIIFSSNAVKFLTTRRWLWFWKQSRTHRRTSRFVQWLLFIVLIGGIAVPVILPYFLKEYNFNTVAFELLNTLLLTLLAVCISGLLAVFFAIFARISWPKILQDFNNKSAIFFIVLFIVFLIPPLCTYLAGFFWFGLVGYTRLLAVITTWILLHAIVALPLLGGFLIAVHFKVKSRELEYLAIYNVGILHIIKWSFLTRFKLEYILTFIFAYALIWNDFGINQVVSDKINSFATVLKMSFFGRGASQGTGLMYLTISILITGLSIFIWRKIIFKANQNVYDS